MLKNMTLQSRMIFAFLLMGLIVLIVAGVGWISTNQLSQHLDTLGKNTLPGIIGLWKINQAQTRIDSLERSLLNPAISQRDRNAELEKMKSAWQRMEEGFKQYEATPVNPGEAEIYKKFKDTWEQWKEEHDEFIKINEQFEQTGILNPFEVQLELVQKNQGNSGDMTTAKEAIRLLNQLRQQAQISRRYFEDSNQSIRQVLKLNEEVASKAQKDGSDDISRSIFWVLTGMVIGPITALIFGIYFSQTIAKPLGAKIAKVVTVAQTISAGDLSTEIQESELSHRDEVGQLLMAFQRMIQNLSALIGQVQQSSISITTSTTEIAASGKQLESMMNVQVASTNEVVSTAKEIASTSQELVQTMQQVANVSEETAKAATQGQTELIRMEATMRKLVNATTGIATKLGIISEKANNINAVVITITKVADQTNLLSLNAAIEAEKAGEYGAGFAVVAREIRRLADQTAVATLDIEQMVKQMQSAVSTGVMEMDKFTQEVSLSVEDVRTISTQLAQIIDRVKTLTPRFESVNHGMESQSQAAQQISQAMINLSDQSIQMAESLQQTNSVLDQLNNATQGLQREISRFKLGNR